jgi:hypothetical protein
LSEDQGEPHRARIEALLDAGLRAEHLEPAVRDLDLEELATGVTTKRTRFPAAIASRNPSVRPLRMHMSACAEPQQLAPHVGRHPEIVVEALRAGVDEEVQDACVIG